MANAYGSEGWSGSASGHAPRRAPKPPSWDEWNRDRRQGWREENPRATATTAASPLADSTGSLFTPPPSTGQPTVPPTASGSYYNPAAYADKGLEGTPLGDIYLNENFGTAVDIWSGGAGLDSGSRFGAYVRSQKQMLESAYRAALYREPQLRPMDFLTRYVGPMRERFETLPYQARGEDPRAWGQGAGRVIS